MPGPPDLRGAVSGRCASRVPPLHPQRPGGATRRRVARHYATALFHQQSESIRLDVCFNTTSAAVCAPLCVPTLGSWILLSVHQGGRPVQILDPNRVRKLLGVWKGGGGGGGGGRWVGRSAGGVPRGWSVGTQTYIPQNDPHDALIILNIHKWGKNFFRKTIAQRCT